MWSPHLNAPPPFLWCQQRVFTIQDKAPDLRRKTCVLLHFRWNCFSKHGSHHIEKSKGAVVVLIKILLCVTFVIQTESLWFIRMSLADTWFKKQHNHRELGTASMFWNGATKAIWILNCVTIQTHVNQYTFQTAVWKQISHWSDPRLSLNLALFVSRLDGQQLLVTVHTGDCTCVFVTTCQGYGKSLSGKHLLVLLLFSHWWVTQWKNKKQTYVFLTCSLF